MSVFDDLANWVEKKPLVLLSFDEDRVESLINSKRGFERFTFARPHDFFMGVKLPTLCLIEMHEEDTCKCYIGVIQSKSAITTFDSRVTIIKLRELRLSSFKALITKIPEKRFRTMLRSKLSNYKIISVQTSKLSSRIIKILAADKANKSALRTAALNLPRLKKVHNVEWGQMNAIQTAIAAFGLGKTEIPESLSVRKRGFSTLTSFEAHILEDNVIGRDSSVIPGFSLIKKDVTGRAVFTKGDERLEVYTANRGPLEKMLGVDLIYVNNTLGNIIMIQYKMLEESKSSGGYGSDWIFRPDKQVKAEISRMKLPRVKNKVTDYRLNPSPFYFKFVKRKSESDYHQSFLVSLEHLIHLLKSHKSKGPKGGLRVSYRALEGTYLRESDIISLIRSGYIGTHRVESQYLKTIISEVAKGNKALVLAWQSKMQQESKLL